MVTEVRAAVDHLLATDASDVSEQATGKYFHVILLHFFTAHGLSLEHIYIYIIWHDRNTFCLSSLEVSRRRFCEPLLWGRCTLHISCAFRRDPGHYALLVSRGELCSCVVSQECVTKQSLVNTVIVDLYNLYARPFAATLTDNLARKTRGPEWRSKQPIYERVFPVSVPVSSVRPPDRGYGYPSV